jgi:alanyl-tRNA synthetase
VPTSDRIRETFLSFFERQGHKIVPSSSLIPFNDPTLLFTNAGMNQFKDVFLGKEERPYRRATTSQKCMRVSGKHNDFKDVGHSTRHHTFFEMLGNFSFGDYFKGDAIPFAWQLVTRDYGLDPRRLWITIYKDDDEAFAVWRDQVGIPSERIVRLGEKDNFWMMGETGPCGPCSELHYDFGRSPLENHAECDLTCPCGRWVEIWNLVFMQYNRDATGTMTPLPSPSIDTGMGFERITTILQEVSSNYDTDLFQPLLREISALCGVEYGADAGDDVSMRIIADHARAATFVIADGQYPGNDKRGYVLRKIMRRAVVHGHKLRVQAPFIYRVSGAVVDVMKAAYPELVAARETVARVIKTEEEAFAETLAGGLRDFYDRASAIAASGSKVLPGEDAFFLYDTRGLPLEIIEDLALEQGLAVDEAGFTRALEEQRARSRQDYQAGKVREAVAEAIFAGKTPFVGYGYSGPVRARVAAVVLDGESADAIAAGQKGEVVLDATPFYAEAGGQVGDTGSLGNERGRARVVDTQYRGMVISHRVEMAGGRLEVGDEVEATVDIEKRRLTMKNHTATHLLHAALKTVLGPHVKQAGSLVAPDRLRFDFTHFAPLSAAELRKVERLVNDHIWGNIPLRTEVMELDQAMTSGAVALFGDKYQDRVRVVEVPGFSKELCGGTHVSATGDIGVFKVVSQESIAAGVRRLEALTGPGAFERFLEDEELLDRVQSEYRVARHDIPGLIERLQGQIRSLERRVTELEAASARSGMDRFLAATRQVSGVKVLASEVPQMDRERMRGLADELKQKLGSGVVILGTPQDGKVALVVMVTRDISERLPAGKIVREIAALVGGSGGGRAELAEAGGKDPGKLADAIQQSYAVVESMLSG